MTPDEKLRVIEMYAINFHDILPLLGIDDLYDRAYCMILDMVIEVEHG